MSVIEQSSQVIENRLLARLKLRQLKLLVTVGEQNNILRASTLLNVAQPAATKMIRDLEATLGIELFERSSRGVTPTLYGEIVIRHAKLILAQVRNASDELLSLHQGATGKISVGTLLAAASSLLPRAIVELRRERPGVTVTVLEGTNDKLMPMLRVGDLDMVVGRLPEYLDRDGLEHEVFYKEPLAIVARKGHPLAQQSKVSLAELHTQEWILPPPQTSLRRQVETVFRRAGLPVPPPAVESVSLLTNLGILRETDMIAAMPFQVAEAQSDMARLPLDTDIAFGTVVATLRAGAEMTPATRYFLSILHRIGAEHG